MSKRIDTTKIERIRDAAIGIIAQQGILNASVAAIARQAGVSVGYLYRHYSGKEELINDLLETYFSVINERISTLLGEGRTLEGIVEGVVRHILESARENEPRSRFLIMLLNDFSVKIHSRLSARVDVLAKELMVKAKRSDRVRDDLRREELFHAMIGLPMQLLGLHYNQIMSNPENPAAHPARVVALSLRIIEK